MKTKDQIIEIYKNITPEQTKAIEDSYGFQLMIVAEKVLAVKIELLTSFPFLHRFIKKEIEGMIKQQTEYLAYQADPRLFLFKNFIEAGGKL